MDALLFHPKIVHLPIALAVLLPLLSGGLLACWLAGLLPQRVMWIAALLQAALLGTSLLAMVTGEAEEDRVEAVVPEAAVEAHEEAAEAFAWATALPLLPLALAGLARRERVGQAAAGAGVLAALVITGLGFRVGEAGGELVYAHNAGAAYLGRAPAAAAGAAPRWERGEEDDD